MMRFSMVTSSPSSAARSSCDFSTKLPRTTTCSSPLSPCRIGVSPLVVCATSTARTAKRSGAVRTNTTSCPSTCCTASDGTKTVIFRALPGTSAVASIPGRRTLPELLSAIRTCIVRVEGSSSCPRLLIFPSNCCPATPATVTRTGCPMRSCPSWSCRIDASIHTCDRSPMTKVSSIVSIALPSVTFFSRM